MAEVEVDVAALRAMAGRLKGLKEAFESQDALVSGSADAFGSPEISGALQDFADNWSDARKELGQMLEEVAGYTLMAADAYADNEGGLSASIDKAAAGGARRSKERP
ncbi:MAG TPA: hypothetical protein VG929_09915 [Actinomycetota bacterium]|nr:hypothetical protein [Actinomycetota bacterium]